MVSRGACSTLSILVCACRQTDDLTEYKSAHHSLHVAPCYAHDCLRNAHLPLQIQIHAAQTGLVFLLKSSAALQAVGFTLCLAKRIVAHNAVNKLFDVQMGFYQDMYGPVIIACLITLVLVAILVLAAIDLANAGL